MTWKTVAVLTLALAILGVVPQSVEAQTDVWSDDVCAEASFNPCVEFDLYSMLDGNGNTQYFFRVTYLGSLGDPEGVMTAAGLYDIDGDGSPWNFTNIQLVAPDENWTFGEDADCEQLSGGGNVLFEGCAKGDNGITNGVAAGGYIEFSFYSDAAISSADFAYYDESGNLVGGDLGARVMIQGVGEEDCSYKLDSPQGLVSGCGVSVPEPISTLLLGTGLAGVGAVALRRRKGVEIETESE